MARRRCVRIILEVRVMNEKNREKTWEFDEVFNFDSSSSKYTMCPP